MKKAHLILAFIILAGLALRFLYFPTNIYFGYDQARDAFISQKIYVEKDLKIQGPPSSGEGIFHGPLFYYLLGPLYLISSGDPDKVIIFFIFLNTLSIYLMYLIAKNITKDVNISLLSALLFAFSYEQTQWAIFQSNTSLASFGLMLLFYGLSKWWFSKKGFGAIVASVGLGIAVQSEVYLLYLLVPIIALFFWKFRSKDLKIITLPLVTLSLFLSTFLLSEVLFKFRGIQSLIATFGHSKIETASFVLNSLIDRFGIITYNNIFGLSPFWGFIFLSGISIYILKLKTKDNPNMKIFIFLFLFSSILLTMIGERFANIYHLSLGASIFAILLCSIWLYRFFSNRLMLYLFIVVILFLQLSLIVKNNIHGATLTLVQKEMLLSDEKRIVELIYKESADRRVGIYVVSNPFNVNTVWSYIFKQYWPKGKMMPEWFGDFAAGYEGESVFLKANHPNCTNFIIYEPLQGVPSYLLDTVNSLKDSRFFNVTKKDIGVFTVEKVDAKECKN